VATFISAAPTVTVLKICSTTFTISIISCRRAQVGRHIVIICVTPARFAIRTKVHNSVDATRRPGGSRRCFIRANRLGSDTLPGQKIESISKVEPDVEGPPL